MMNFLKKVKNLFSPGPAKDSDSVMPGTDSQKEDVGKKVFEKTGQLREGIGQSSTVVQIDDTTQEFHSDERLKPQQTPSKHHGIRKRKNVIETNTKPSSSHTKSHPSNQKNTTPNVSGNKISPARRKPKFKQKTK